MKNATDPAKLAIECRKVRMYVAGNPGQTSREISEGTGVRSAHTRLLRMMLMGIVRQAQEKQEDGTRPTRWYVVPQ